MKTAMQGDARAGLTSIQPRRWLTWLGLITLVSVAAPTQAQQIDASGQCPAELEAAQAESASDQYFVINARPDVFVGAADDRKLDASVTANLPMHTGLLKIREEGDRILFRTLKPVANGRNLCGWYISGSEPDVLQRNPPPRRVGNEIDWTDPVTGKSKKLKNPLPLKAMLRSNPEFESGDATQVSIYDKPSITSTKRTDASVFGIYSVFSERLLDDGLWYWIAGTQYNAHLPTDFAGWVPEEFVLIWRTQLSLFFNASSDNTDIFVNQESARMQAPDSVISRRPADFRERAYGLPDATNPKSSNIARFPIIQEEQKGAGRGQTIYKIGFFGDSAEVDLTSDRGRKQQSVRKIDILFVLDNTLSMTEYFPYVIQAVRRSTDRIETINREEGYDVEVKYAAAIYGDYGSTAASFDDVQFQVLARLGSPGYTEHLGRLTAIAEDGDYFQDALVDKPEAGLAGVVRGIQELEWTAGTEFKVVVWIGDHGSREYGNSENVSVEDARRVIADNDVLLLPINVSGRYSDVWNGEFIRQGNELAAVRGLETSIAHSFSQSDDYVSAAEEIEESIANLYLSSLATSFAIREGTNISQTLESRRDLLDLDIPAAEADVLKISTAICEIAFGNTGCVNVRNTGQFMADGYVKYDERLGNYDFWVNMTAEDLDILSRVMELSCRGFERSLIRENIEQAMALVTQTFGGERYRSDIPIGEFLRRYLFLPADYFPSFLESTPDKIDEQWQLAVQSDLSNGGQNVETTRIASPICRSAALLELAFDGKRLVDPATDLVPVSFLEDNPRKPFSWTVVDQDRVLDFDWEWSQGGENNYFYLPVEFFPSRIQ